MEELSDMLMQARCMIGSAYDWAVETSIYVRMDVKRPGHWGIDCMMHWKNALYRIRILFVQMPVSHIRIRNQISI